jgi:hypothetical protein
MSGIEKLAQSPVMPEPCAITIERIRAHHMETMKRQIADEEIPALILKGPPGDCEIWYWNSQRPDYHQWNMLPLLLEECAGSPEKMWFYDRFVTFLAASDFRDDICHSALPRNPNRAVLVEAILLMIPRFSFLMSKPRVPALDFDGLVGAGNWLYRPTDYENPHDNSRKIVNVPIPLTPKALAVFQMIDWDAGE